MRFAGAILKTVLHRTKKYIFFKKKLYQAKNRLYPKIRRSVVIRAARCGEARRVIAWFQKLEESGKSK